MITRVLQNDIDGKSIRPFSNLDYTLIDIYRQIKKKMGIPTEVEEIVIINLFNEGKEDILSFHIKRPYDKISEQETRFEIEERLQICKDIQRMELLCSAKKNRNRKKFIYNAGHYWILGDLFILVVYKDGKIYCFSINDMSQYTSKYLKEEID